MTQSTMPPITRQDEVVQRAASRLLLHSAHSAVKSHVTCRAESGKLVIEGTVPSYYLKQMAQETIRPVKREHVIVNAITVRK